VGTTTGMVPTVATDGTGGTADATAGSSGTPSPSLTPLQRRTLAALQRRDDPVPVDTDLVAELRDEAMSALDHFGERVGDSDRQFINKHRLAAALGCEEQFLLPDDFEWTPARAKGKVAHRAIQLLVSWRGDPTTMDLVDEAIERLAADDRDSIAPWIAGLADGDRADLHGQSVERVEKFRECFPPLRAGWRPVAEARTRWPNDGPVVLAGQADLTIGRPTAGESTKVIVDFKTGGTSPLHRQDLGFYSLLETMKSEIPPRKVATLYLDSGEIQAEDVGERFLRSALRRTLDGIHAVVELTVEDRPPIRRPGTSCRWCPLLDECDDGRHHLAEPRR
jgi:hypothetical protein